MLKRGRPQLIVNIKIKINFPWSMQLLYKNLFLLIFQNKDIYDYDFLLTKIKTEFMNFSALNLFRKLLITALSITGLLISKTSFANNWVEIKTTYVLNHSQYLAALMRHNASEVYILYRGIWLITPGLQDVLRKDTIVNYKNLQKPIHM